MPRGHNQIRAVAQRQKGSRRQEVFLLPVSFAFQHHIIRHALDAIAAQMAGIPKPMLVDLLSMAGMEMLTSRESHWAWLAFTSTSNLTANRELVSMDQTSAAKMSFAYLATCYTSPLPTCLIWLIDACLASKPIVRAQPCQAELLLDSSR